VFSKHQVRAEPLTDFAGIQRLGVIGDSLWRHLASPDVARPVSPCMPLRMKQTTDNRLEHGSNAARDQGSHAAAESNRIAYSISGTGSIQNNVVASAPQSLPNKFRDRNVALNLQTQAASMLLSKHRGRRC